MWVSFILGRPGNEYTFEVPPEAMDITEQGVSVVQRNLAGDMKKSTLKVSAPTIKLNSSFLSLSQRNQFSSLVGVSDTFLSFQTRDDWQQVNDLASVVSPTVFQLQNASSLRLSKALVQLGLPSIITIADVQLGAAGTGAFGEGAFGAGPFGGQAYTPGTITYNDLTYQLTTTNPVPDTTAPVYVTYTYKGWLVNLEKLDTKYKGGWLDRATYDFQLTGA